MFMDQKIQHGDDVDPPRTECCYQNSQHYVFLHVDKIILKFTWEGKGTARIAKTTLKKKKVGGTTPPNINTCYIATMWN